jgi:Flp pilus assembly protein TadG
VTGTAWAFSDHPSPFLADVLCWETARALRAALSDSRGPIKDVPVDRGQRRRSAAFSAVYTMVAFTALCGVVSLSVDYGRVQLANAELQSSADAAARHAATGLSNGTAVAKAQSVAEQNYVDGSPLTLLSSDVQTGTWNSSTGTFTAGGSSPNAVRVIAYRTTARGTAISLFAQAIGKSS